LSVVIVVVVVVVLINQRSTHASGPMERMNIGRSERKGGEEVVIERCCIGVSVVLLGWTQKRVRVCGCAVLLCLTRKEG